MTPNGLPFLPSRRTVATAAAATTLTGVLTQTAAAAPPMEPSPHGKNAPGRMSQAALDSDELMRSFFLNRQTNQRVEEYLAGNDLLFIGLGPTEMHGGMPLDAETVIAEAFALKMAQVVDGLALGGLSYLYAGGTTAGRGTVQLTARKSSDLIFDIGDSLNRQGFTRQVYVSFHGPTHYLVAPAIRDLFDRTGTAPLYIDLTKVMGDDPSVLDGNSFYSIFLGAYDILGRLGDVPLTTADHDHSTPADSTVGFLAPLNALAPQSTAIGYYFGAPSDHGVTPKLETAEDRQKLADQGVAVIQRMVDGLDLPEIISLMSELKQMQDGLDAAHLPKNYYRER